MPAGTPNDLSRPAISLWEHRLARRRLRAKHRGEIDEATLFAAVEEMRAAARDAARLTRSARRDRTRRARAPDLPAAPPSAEAALPPVSGEAVVVGKERGNVWGRRRERRQLGREGILVRRSRPGHCSD